MGREELAAVLFHHDPGLDLEWNTPSTELLMRSEHIVNFENNLGQRIGDHRVEQCTSLSIN